jgi:hypothetical protein
MDSFRNAEEPVQVAATGRQSSDRIDQSDKQFKMITENQAAKMNLEDVALNSENLKIGADTVPFQTSYGSSQLPTLYENIAKVIKHLFVRYSG